MARLPCVGNALTGGDVCAHVAGVISKSWRWLPLLAVAPALMGPAPLRELLTGESSSSENENENESESGSEASPDPEPVLAARRQLAERIAAIAERIQAAATAGDPAFTGALTAELDALERRDWVYAQQLTALARHRSLQLDLENAREQLEAPSRGEAIETLPLTLTLLDRRRAELDMERQRTDTVADAVRVAEEAVDQAAREERDLRQTLGDAQRALRNAEPETEATLRQQVRATLAAADTATELGSLRRLELNNERTARDLLGENVNLLLQRIHFIRARLQIDPNDVEGMLDQLDEEAFDLKNARNTAQLELAAAERRLRDSQERLDAVDSPSVASTERVAAARLAVQTRQQTAAVLGERLARVEAAGEVWRRRYQVLAGGTGAQELRDWKQSASITLDQLERQLRRESARLAELRRNRQALTVRLDAAHPHLSIPLREQDRHLADLISTYEQDRVGIHAAQQLHRLLLDDIQAHAEELPWFDRALASLERALEVWRTELFTVEDSAITLATLVTAVLLLLLGYLVSRFLSRMLGQRLLPRLGLQTGAIAALQTLTFYLLFVAFTLGALRMVNVPLTAFTVLGGALAIGVGFGSQNIVNNFISGLILLIEQPIKVDDLIEVDGTYGKVEHIGTRSTRVRTFSNVHIIVPNSTFLEKNVINWTLSDNLVRVQVHVGVAYGSPTREVERLVLQAVSDTPRIVGFPVPEVFFADFGDNALVFHAHFWIQLNNQNDRRRIESDVRFRIDELFREAEIVIAFPQRDVHLDTPEPLDVRVVPAEKS